MSGSALSVGVIGTGSIGTDHAHRLARSISGARVHAVFDVDAGRAASVAGDLGALPRASAAEVMEDPDVDAVLVASADESHAEMVLGCIAAGKPVLCEKPLAPTTAECLEVIAAERSSGRRTVQVGFMRRYDPGFLALESAITSGQIGEVLLLHCVHRNASSPPNFTSSMSFTSSVIHEIDTARWLLGEELSAVTVVATRNSPLVPADLRDPQLALIESASGVVVEVEVFVNCQYGYDVRCEVVGSTGTTSLDEPSSSTLATAGARRQPIVADWRDRFAGAYHEELQRWVDDTRAGLSATVATTAAAANSGGPSGPSGPSAWDGYAATAVAECAVKALESGVRVAVDLEARPDFYS